MSGTSIIAKISMSLSTFQGKFYFQGLFKTVLYIQVLFKPVRTLMTKKKQFDFLAPSEESDKSDHLPSLIRSLLCVQRVASNLCYLHAPSTAFNQLNLYSKTSVKLPLSKRPKIGFQDQLSLNAVQKYCRMLQGSILQYFRPSLSYHLSLRSLFCYF